MNNIIDWDKKGIDAILLSNPKNIRHFTNLQCSFGFVILTKNEIKLIVDGRYFETSKNIFKSGNIVLYKGIETLKDEMKNYNTVAIEEDFVTIEFKKFFKNVCKNLIGINGQKLRIVKDKFAIHSLEKAVKITKDVMEWASKKLVDGISEKEISRLVKFRLDELGSEDLDYEPIISSGPNSSLPHAKPSKRKMKSGETVMFDFAAVIDGYTADITRNFFVKGKEPDSEIIKIEKIVRESQMAGIKAIKPGVTGAKIDAICREVIVKAGYGDKFIHGTGHGLGRDVHELPNVNKLSTIPFVPGHVITVEPGIYIEGKGGIRIEDDILVTKKGYKIL